MNDYVFRQNVENKFQTAAEVRDFLVLAGQHLSAAHQNLNEHVVLPYCTLDEINTLIKVVKYHFNINVCFKKLKIIIFHFF